MLLKSHSKKKRVASTMGNSMMTSSWMTIWKKFLKLTNITIRVNHLLIDQISLMNISMTLTSNLPKRLMKYRQNS